MSYEGKEFGPGELKDTFGDLVEIDRKLAELLALRQAKLNDFYQNFGDSDATEEDRFRVVVLDDAHGSKDLAYYGFQERLTFLEAIDEQLGRCGGQTIAWLTKKKRTSILGDIKHSAHGVGQSSQSSPGQPKVITSEVMLGDSLDLFFGKLPPVVGLAIARRSTPYVRVESYVSHDVSSWCAGVEDKLSPATFSPKGDSIWELPPNSIWVHFSSDTPCVIVGDVAVQRLIGSFESISMQEKLRGLFTRLYDPSISIELEHPSFQD